MILWVAGGGGSLTDHNHTASGDGGVLTADEHASYSEYQNVASEQAAAADLSRIYSKDFEGTAGDARLHVQGEDGDPVAIGNNEVAVPKPAAATGASQVGRALSMRASDAAASTDTAGAAAGGPIGIYTGSAQRNTSGNADGGELDIWLGTGIGTGARGSLSLTCHNASFAIEGDFTYGVAGDTVFNCSNDLTLNCDVFTLSANSIIGLRGQLTAARTYYVRTDGSDSNTGLVDSAGGAFLTIQKAVDVASALDNGGFDITIQVKDGTYTGAVSLKSFVGSGQIIIQGNSGTPANVLISVTSANAIVALAVIGVYTIKDLKIVTTTSGSHIIVDSPPTTVFFGNIDFGASAGLHLVSANGAILKCTGNYSITGGASYHAYASEMGHIEINLKTITLTGTPAFSGEYAHAETLSLNRQVGNTYSGSATGKRYNAITNSVISTGGGGATYFPGNAAGTTATGGQYV